MAKTIKTQIKAAVIVAANKAHSDEITGLNFRILDPTQISMLEITDGSIPESELTTFQEGIPTLKYPNVEQERKTAQYPINYLKDIITMLDKMNIPHCTISIGTDTPAEITAKGTYVEAGEAHAFVVRYMLAPRISEDGIQPHKPLFAAGD